MDDCTQAEEHGEGDVGGKVGFEQVIAVACIDGNGTVLSRNCRGAGWR